MERRIEMDEHVSIIDLDNKHNHLVNKSRPKTDSSGTNANTLIS